MMKKLIWLLLVAVAIYSGYWMVGAKGTETAISAWMSARAQEGWQAEASEVDTHGYPLRFDTDIRDLSLADPRTGVAFSTERLALLSKSHAPTRFTARLAETAVLASPYQRIDIGNEVAEADLFVSPGPNLTLDHAAIRLDGLTLSSTLDWGVTLESSELASQRRDADPLTHDITFRANGITPTGGLIERLDPDGLLSDRLEVANMDVSATFDRDWDIHALEGPRPQLTHIDIESVSITWGALSLQTAGSFDVDAKGYPDGEIAIKAVNWREMIELAVGAGAIPQDLRKLALRSGEMLAGLSGRKDTIDATLTLKNGMITMGFIPLGPAPRLVIR